MAKILVNQDNGLDKMKGLGVTKTNLSTALSKIKGLGVTKINQYTALSKMKGLSEAKINHDGNLYLPTAYKSLKQPGKMERIKENNQNFQTIHVGNVNVNPFDETLK